MGSLRQFIAFTPPEDDEPTEIMPRYDVFDTQGNAAGALKEVYASKEAADEESPEQVMDLAQALKEVQAQASGGVVRIVWEEPEEEVIDLGEVFKKALGRVLFVEAEVPRGEYLGEDGVATYDLFPPLTDSVGDDLPAPKNTMKDKGEDDGARQAGV